MELTNGKMTNYLDLPAHEAMAIIGALKQAEETNDIEAMKWCARNLVWLASKAEISAGDDEHCPAHIFNKAWDKQLKADPVPESITAFFTKNGTAATEQESRTGLIETFEKLDPGNQAKVLAYTKAAVVVQEARTMNTEPVMKPANGANELNTIFNGLLFWPTERVEEIFSRMETAKGTPDENRELRIFAERMKWLYENQTEDYIYTPDSDSLFALVTVGEVAADAARTEKLEAMQ